MPCRPIEDDPSLQPSRANRAATLLIWLCKTLHRQAPAWALEVASERKVIDSRPTPALCELVRSLSERELRQVTDPQNGPLAIELAEWWREHREWDEKRRQ